MKRPGRAGTETQTSLAREVAHDLNNLLTAVIGAADAILTRPDIDPETRADVEAIREGACRGGALAQSLRGQETAAPDPVSVNATIRATSRLMAHQLGRRIALTLELGEPDCFVRTDPSRLDRVLLNLAANARQAMPDGGTVALRTGTRLVEAAERHVPDTIPPGDYAVISVADNGAGIPAGDLPRIFERGFTTRGGTGLGLPSVLAMVRQSNGHLAVETADGRGTSFEIYLPAVAASSLAAGPPVKTPGVAATGGTILVVEDDPLIRGMAERVLTRAGWCVVSADSAEAALALLDGPGGACGIVFSDLSLPGMDGVALARQVGARWPGLPFILTSGYEIAPPEAEGVRFLSKPYGQEALLAAVASGLKRSGQAG
ncbi:MAG: response regulator [Acetobacteraceae bacterium]|nr:response regulator [Acetobacteraceae bacterium]